MREILTSLHYHIQMEIILLTRPPLLRESRSQSAGGTGPLAPPFGWPVPCLGPWPIRRAAVLPGTSIQSWTWRYSAAPQQWQNTRAGDGRGWVWVNTQQQSQHLTPCGIKVKDRTFCRLVLRYSSTSGRSLYTKWITEQCKITVI